MKIGILQTGLAPTEIAKQTGEYPEMFAELLAGHGFTFEAWPVVEGVFPEKARAADGWLITGSRHGAYDNLPWIAPLEALIREAYAASVPMVGVCFGHQIIAQALGGTVEKYKGGWIVGPQDYDFPDGPLRLQAWHQDQVITPPEGAETLASGEGCRYAALYYPGHAYTVQPHPEYEDDFVQGLIRHRGPGVVPDALMRAAETRMGAPLNRAALAEQFARFFKTGAPA